MAELRAADIAPSELAELLSDAKPAAGETAWCWLEAPDAWALDKWPGLDGQITVQRAHRLPDREAAADFLRRASSGRVFAPSGELRWRVLPALGDHPVRVVFLGENWSGSSLNGLAARTELQGLVRSEETYPLWGQQTQATQDAWVELRIPHRLHYPVDVGGTDRGRIIVRLGVQLWKDRRGVVQLLRLCSLTPSVE